MQKSCINKISLCSQLAWEITVVVHWKWLWANTFDVILGFIFSHEELCCDAFFLVFYEQLVGLCVTEELLKQKTQIFFFYFFFSSRKEH